MNPIDRRQLAFKPGHAEQRRPYKHYAPMLLLAALFVFGVAAPAIAQESGIQGTIVDASKGVLPGVVVKATHIDTGTSQQTVTNGEGRYFFQEVRIGGYELTADLSGFATVRRTGVTVQVGQMATIDLQMQLATLQDV